jgi:methyl-accepting chemotaxis protein
LISWKIYKKAIITSAIASSSEIAAIIVLLLISTELGFGHLVKATPSLLFVVIYVNLFEFVLFRRWLSQTRAYDKLEESGGSQDQLGPQALLAQEELVKLPTRIALLVCSLWISSALILFVSLMLGWGETFFLWELVFVAVITVLAGAVSLVFHYYFVRRIVRRDAQTILTFDTGYHLSQAEVGLFQIRRKLNLSFIPLIFTGLALVTALGFFQTAVIIRETYEQQLRRLKNDFQESKSTLEQLQTEMNSFSKLMGANLFLVNDDGVDPVSKMSQEFSKDFVTLLKESTDQEFTYRYNSKLIFSLTNLGTFDGKRVFLVLVYDWDKSLPLEYRMLGIMIVIVLGLTMLAFFILKLMSDDLVEPLNRMMEQTDRVSHGDLSVDFNIISDDELGVLAARQKAMVLSLRDLVERVRTSYEQVRMVISEIMTSSEVVARGTQEQTSAIADTSQNIAQVNQIVKEVSDNTEVLHSSGQETMQRSEEMIRLVEDVGASLEELGKAVEVSSSSIYQMSVAIKEVAGNVEQLSRRSEETSSAVVEMQKSISSVADTSRQSREVSERMRKSAEQGVKAVQETIQGISTIEDTVGQARSTLENLGKSTDQIGKILKVIREVANRTNLLALNAAIIAAQAGEQGQGFAVVADEIKNLADRVANSTIEIDQIIKKVQDDATSMITVMEKSFTQVETGVNLSYEAGMALERISKAVEQSFTMAESISSATDQQVESSKKAAGEISSIAELIQQIAVSTREQSKGADQMAKAGQDIKKHTELVLSRSRKQSSEAQQVQVAMENVEQMIKFILDAQRGQGQASERIVAAISKVKNTAVRNAQSVGELDKNIAILNQQSEVLKGVLKQFRIGVPGEEEPEPS